jgi:DNA-directed RNA polymerase specialized sigma24 family protein
MALRRSATGMRFVDAGRETSADAPFQAHLPKLALFCFRLTRDAEKAALLAERVLLEARRRIASSPGAPGPSALLFSVLREECATTVRLKPPPPAMKPLRAAGDVP